jgi:hypothetical protein
MHDVQTMTLAEIRAELRRMGVTDRYVSSVLRELAVVQERVLSAEQKPGAPPLDVARANFNVLRAHGMALRDYTLTRKGELFVELADRESEEQAIAA